MILFQLVGKKHFEKTSMNGAFVLGSPMRMVPDRAVLTVTRHEGVWRVEYEGQHFGHSRDKEIAKAAANRHARSVMDGGRSCEVRVSGEHGFWAV
ncbi:MAG TPA: hypothetical protein VFH92_05525 [Phenylobacterium sp.]|nr:hypothetical protein [Phenylobacterium sp.]